MTVRAADATLATTVAKRTVDTTTGVQTTMASAFSTNIAKLAEA